MKRLKNAWKALCGEEFKPPAVYSYDTTPRIVQLQYYHDYLIALTHDGDLYRIRPDYSDSYPIIELWMHNPMRRNYA